MSSQNQSIPPAASSSIMSQPSTFATFIRGGTSKALFFHEKDIPAPGPIRDEFLIRVMGSPDPSQIDGMGGSRIVTSKIAIIRPSTRPDADVDYTFAQVGLGEVDVDYSGNCGNISSGVGPFAINEGLLTKEVWKDGKRIVRIYNTGEDALLVAHVPVDPATGRALEKGDCAISGCPGTGAPILMDYSQVAKPKIMLPTGNVIDKLDCSFGQVEATYCEVGNPIVFVYANVMGIKGDEMPPALDSDTALIARIREVRGRMAQKVGRCSDWSKVDEQAPMLPMVALVSKATSSTGDVQSRLFLDNHCHPAMAGTGAICTTTVSRLPGSIVNQLLSADSLKSEYLNIQHPAGHLPIKVKTEASQDHLPVFEILGFMRTARYLFQGRLFVPADIQDHWTGPASTTSTVETAPAQAVDQQQVGHAISAKKAEAAPAKREYVTKRLVAFTQNLKFNDLSSEAVARLRECLLDFIGVGELGSKVSESSPVFLKGVEAVTQGFPSTHKVLGGGKKFPPQYAAMLNGAYAHSLDFDDTHTGGIIHVAATVIAAGYTEAQSHPDLSLEQFLVALAAGYEVSCRVAIALGVSSWHRGFHNTSIAGIFGAVAVLSKLRGLSTQQTENAFGLAVSFASGSMQYLANGAWNKRLHPAKAAHDSFIVVAMAQAGVLGAAQPIEGQYGLIAAHTDTPDAQVDVSDLGQRWEFVNTSFKPYPACRVTHTSIELASLMSPKDVTDRVAAVKNIKIIMDVATFPVVGEPIPNKIHPNDVVDAQFSAYYQAAATWLYGDQQGWSIYDHIHEPAIHALCDKITIKSKKFPDDLITTMVVTWQDGKVQEQTLEKPKWQFPERPPPIEEVIQKFKSLAVPVLGDAKSGEVVECVTGPLEGSFGKLVDLLS